MYELCMPALGADMEYGVLTEWCVKAGDTVKKGDIVALVETQKAALEVETWKDGVVKELCVDLGEKVPVGETILRLQTAEIDQIDDAKGKDKTAIPAQNRGLDHTQEKAESFIAHAGSDGLEGGEQQRVRATPVARKLAAANKIDISLVTATGSDGAVTKSDVEHFLKLGIEKKGFVEAGKEAESSTRAAIARLMERSKREIPHYYLHLAIDMSTAMDWLALENEKRPIEKRMVYAALLLRALTLAAQDFPTLNGFWQEGRFEQAEGVDLGVAVSLRKGGLIAPTICKAHQLNLEQQMERLGDLVTRARKGVLRSSEMAPPSITITNLGERGVDTVYGVIYPPQVALVGFGRLQQRPCCVGGQILARSVIEVTLAADHRASDGHLGAGFLDAIDKYLQKPGLL